MMQRKLGAFEDVLVWGLMLSYGVLAGNEGMDPQKLPA